MSATSLLTWFDRTIDSAREREHHVFEGLRFSRQYTETTEDIRKLSGSAKMTLSFNTKYGWAVYNMAASMTDGKQWVFFNRGGVTTLNKQFYDNGHVGKVRFYCMWVIYPYP